MQTFTKILIASAIAATLSHNIDAAQSVTLEVGLYTHHINQDPTKIYNNDNQFKAIEYATGDWYFNAAHFVNTYYNDSYSVGIGYNVWSGYGVDFDVLGGVIYGYNEGELESLCLEGLCTFIAPRFTYSFEVTPQWTIKPSVKLLGSAVNVAIGAEYKF